MLFRPAMVSGEPFMLTLNSVLPIFAVPDGRIRFCALMAVTTSVGVMPFACSAWVSRSTDTRRDLPPYGYGTAAPGMVTSCGRRKLTAVSNSDCSGSVLLDKASWITGIDEAEYLMISGGVIPGGSCLTCACSIATTCDGSADVGGRLEEDLDDAGAGQ